MFGMGLEEGLLGRNGGPLETVKEVLDWRDFLTVI